MRFGCSKFFLLGVRLAVAGAVNRWRGVIGIRGDRGRNTICRRQFCLPLWAEDRLTQHKRRGGFTPRDSPRPGWRTIGESDERGVVGSGESRSCAKASAGGAGAGFRI